MKHQNITIYSVSDPTGTHAPSAGANGYLGQVALEKEVIKTINSLTPTNSGGFAFITDGTLEVIPLSAGNILLRLYTSIASSLAVVPTFAEVGQSLSGADLSWTSNKNEISQSLNNGIGAITNGVRAYHHADTITATRTYTLTITDGQTTATPSATITFEHRRFWDSTALDTNLTAANISGAANSELSTGRAKTITFTPGGNHIFYAYPTAFGLATVKDGNGFTFTDWRDGGVQSTSPYIVSYTNAYGFTENYYVYHSFNTYAGSVTFIWS